MGSYLLLSISLSLWVQGGGHSIKMAVALGEMIGIFISESSSGIPLSAAIKISNNQSLLVTLMANSIISARFFEASNGCAW